ncbi:hypothetical protein [Burkholderia cepacia]|uniref:hypothetical protein n=1 Tax=Burkholderia cepacia TaxID=292 RepID=UPI00158C88A3|nr:hypothetical protein [Burkholderia cepacia]
MGAIAQVGPKIFERMIGVGGKEAGGAGGSSPIDALMHDLLGSGLKTLEALPSAKNNS